jgi:uncharacterized protein (TIGR00369 family)
LYVRSGDDRERRNRPLIDGSGLDSQNQSGMLPRDANRRSSLSEEGAMDLDPNLLHEQQRGTLGGLLRIRYVEVTKERVVAELQIRDELRTLGGALHGGTIMAFADTLGAVATFVNLPPSAGTTTLESKTNFFAPGRDGTVRAECIPLHRGRRTMVWQTRITDEGGRLLAQTIQTQMVLTQPE